MSAMFVAAMREMEKNEYFEIETDRGLRGVSLQQRIEKAMTVSMDKELDELDTRMGFLASTGSVAPLVGLFGTVWGIINSFNAICGNAEQFVVGDCARYCRGVVYNRFRVDCRYSGGGGL